MKRFLFSVVAVLAACDPSVATINDTEVELDDGTDDLCSASPSQQYESCINDGTKTARALLTVMSTADEQLLRTRYSLSRTQRGRVLEYRKGWDHVLGTADDRVFTSISQLQTATGFTCCTLLRLANLAVSERSCVSYDGLCPSGCEGTDPDCGPTCGDGVVDQTETCDGNCPASCDDQNACTTDGLTGAAATCDAVCVSMPVTACVSGDGCCAPGCTWTNDNDCAQPSYLLSGDAQQGQWAVDDDVVVEVNGVEVFRDWLNGIDPIAPLSLNASPGDTVVLRFYDTGGGIRSHGALWLSGTNVAPHQVAAAYAGGRSDYRAQAKQPFHIVAFTIPSSGQAQPACLPHEPLDTSSWKPDWRLTVHEASSKKYRARWNVNGAEYDYTADCDGWVQDGFIYGSSYVTVRWNTITNQLETRSVVGRAYTSADANAGVSWAIQTLFPAGDMSQFVMGP